MSSATVWCRDVYGQIHETPTDELQWRPAAYGIVIKESKVLLLRQFGDKYELPGGGVDLGESPDEAVLREIKEETGVSARSPHSLGIESCLFRAAHSDNRSYHSLLLYYSCEYVSGDLTLDGLDDYEKRYVQSAEWVHMDSIEDIQIGSTVDFRPYIQKAYHHTNLKSDLST